MDTKVTTPGWAITENNERCKMHMYNLSPDWCFVLMLKSDIAKFPLNTFAALDYTDQTGKACLIRVQICEKREVTQEGLQDWNALLVHISPQNNEKKAINEDPKSSDAERRKEFRIPLEDNVALKLNKNSANATEDAGDILLKDFSAHGMLISMPQNKQLPPLGESISLNFISTSGEKHSLSGVVRHIKNQVANKTSQLGISLDSVPPNTLGEITEHLIDKISIDDKLLRQSGLTLLPLRQKDANSVKEEQWNKVQKVRTSQEFSLILEQRRKFGAGNFLGDATKSSKNYQYPDCLDACSMHFYITNNANSIIFSASLHPLSDKNPSCQKSSLFYSITEKANLWELTNFSGLPDMYNKQEVIWPLLWTVRNEMARLQGDVLFVPLNAGFLKTLQRGCPLKCVIDRSLEHNNGVLVLHLSASDLKDANEKGESNETPMKKIEKNIEPNAGKNMETLNSNEDMEMQALYEQFFEQLSKKSAAVRASFTPR